MFNFLTMMIYRLFGIYYGLIRQNLKIVRGRTFAEVITNGLKTLEN